MKTTEQKYREAFMWGAQLLMRLKAERLRSALLLKGFWAARRKLSARAIDGGAPCRMTWDNVLDAVDLMDKTIAADNRRLKRMKAGR